MLVKEIISKLLELPQDSQFLSCKRSEYGYEWVLWTKGSDGPVKVVFADVNENLLPIEFKAAKGMIFTGQVEALKKGFYQITVNNGYFYVVSEKDLHWLRNTKTPVLLADLASVASDTQICDE